MRIYLCARYGRREELLSKQAMLTACGHTVTSTWLEGKTNDDYVHRHRQAARAVAAEDLRDIHLADVFVAFTEVEQCPGSSRGGRHVELGYAICRAIARRPGPLHVAIVGPRENIFCALDVVEQFPTWPSCLKWINTL